MKLSLIIPCYNEAANLPRLLERCKGVVSRSGWEVVLVDNGSTDNSQAVLAELLPAYPGCRSIRVAKNQGYGFGILAGLRAAKGDVLAWTHADLQTDPDDVVLGAELFTKHGLDIFVKGRRYGRPMWDIVFTVAMSLFETVLLGYPFWDINAQPSMFSRQFFMSWQSPPNDFSLDLYAYYQARLLRRKVFRFPVRFGPRFSGSSHWNTSWREKKRFIQRTVDFSLQLKKTLKS